MSKPTPQIIRIVVKGETSWSAEEHRTIGAFRGSRSKVCAVKDLNGKRAEAATRRIVILIIAADGVIYRFEHDATMSDDGCKSLVIHGQSYDVRGYVDFPASVMAAHAKTARKVKACLRIMRAEVAALPAFRALAVSK